MESNCFFSTDKPVATSLRSNSRHFFNPATTLNPKPSSFSPTHHALRRRFARNAISVAKPADMAFAHHVFDEMPLLDTFAWNSLIQTHLLNGELRHVVFTYRQMLLRGVRPDRWTIPRILSAVSRLAGDLAFGEQVHGQAIRLGFASDQYVVTALLEMYGSLEGVDKARRMILDRSPMKNSVSWTLIARMYVKEGKPGSAIALFREMADSGADIDNVAMATAIGAAAAMRSLKEGRSIHRVARERGLEFDVLVSNSMLKMYIDCGAVEEARSVFDRTPSKDLISWTGMIQAYVKRGGYNEGLKLFNRMITGGMMPDLLSFSSVLPACARMTANKQGRELHGHLLRRGFEPSLTVLNALIDMYAKSGCLDSAHRMFSRLRYRDPISWTMMISGFSHHGRGELGVELFHEMAAGPSANRIDPIAFAAVLHACATSRSVEDGKLVFGQIESPGASHHTLMVALLANAGLFDEAEDFVREQRLEHRAEVLRALLDGCRAHQNEELGKRVAEQLCEIEPHNTDNYVLLTNWYTHFGEYEKAGETMALIGEMGLKLKQAFSWIELRNKVHVFRTGDASHPRLDEIYSELERLMSRMQANGFEPRTDFSLHDVPGERECPFISHSEMLAISFGLLSTPAGSTIRVTKNHRVCRACHDTAKAVSDVSGREIVLKDLNRFHHFRGGVCSCDDVW